jgi:hypothetical protein
MMELLLAACSFVRKRPVRRPSGVEVKLAFHLCFSGRTVFQQGLEPPALNCLNRRSVQTVTQYPENLDVSQTSISSECRPKHDGTPYIRPLGFFRVLRTWCVQRIYRCPANPAPPSRRVPVIQGMERSMLLRQQSEWKDCRYADGYRRNAFTIAELHVSTLHPISCRTADAIRHLSNFVNSFLCCRITFSHKNAQLFHKVGAVTVRTKLSGEPRLASAARYLFSS